MTNEVTLGGEKRRTYWKRQKRQQGCGRINDRLCIHAESNMTSSEATVCMVVSHIMSVISICDQQGKLYYMMREVSAMYFLSNQSI
jgi:hypothetical protein